MQPPGSQAGQLERGNDFVKIENVIVGLATSTYSLVQTAGEGFSVSRQPVKFTRVRPGESLLD